MSGSYIISVTNIFVLLKMKRSVHILKLIFLVGLFLFSQCNAIETLLENDKQALVDFLEKLPHLHALNWDMDLPVCKNWTGVACNEDGSRVVSLRLPGVGFRGSIPENTLGKLSALQILSLRANGINGTFPFELMKLKNLSALYLQSNYLTGNLPDNFSVWKYLSIVDLSRNKFSGSIPSSISSLKKLSSLNFANNWLSGEIPDFGLPKLQSLNFSYNNLSGIVPQSLQRFPKSVFVGNSASLLNYNVSSSLVVSIPRETSSKSKNVSKFSERALLGIIVTASLLGVLGFGFLLLVLCLREKNEVGFPGKLEKEDISLEKAVSRTQDAANRLSFFEGCSYAFDLEDLLRASAEVLGKGTFGTSYKAILEDASMVVVKRLKDVSAGKKDFEQQMEVVGRIKHDNVVALRAYYYSKDEKLMVSDYYVQGSVATMLHGKKGGTKTTLDWDTRVRIATGAARGIARVHTENGGKFVHGNIKSSNIFLNSKQYGCVSDFGTATIMSPLAHPIARAAGYRAPELTDTRKSTQASDVYSFGVFVLELLTAKSPVHTTSGDEVIHLVRWVHSVVREEWTGEVFDVELMKYPNIDEELVEMLQIALSCVVRTPDERPKMFEVVKLMEDLKPDLLMPEACPKVEQVPSVD